MDICVNNLYKETIRLKIVMRGEDIRDILVNKDNQIPIDIEIIDTTEVYHNLNEVEEKYYEYLLDSLQYRTQDYRFVDHDKTEELLNKEKE